MSIHGLDPRIANKLAEAVAKSEALEKSFNQVPNVGVASSGRTGIGALFNDRSASHFNIALNEDDLYFSKNISDVKSGISYSYTLKNSAGDGWADMAIAENMIGKEVMGNYQRINLPLKVYGGKTSVSHMMMVANEGDDFDINAEQEEKENLMITISRSQEHDAHFGCDYYLDSNGDFEELIGGVSLNVRRRLNLRHAFGLQSYIRQHDFSYRAISPEMAGYGNIKSVVNDLAGEVLDQSKLDRFMEAPHDAGGRLSEAHCTFAQARAFRENFFPYQRGDIGAGFKINGPDINSEMGAGFTITTTAGPIRFMPQRLRKLQMKKVAYGNSQLGSQPATPGAITLTSVAGQNTSFKAGQKVLIAVQAVNLFGLSEITTAIHIIAADGEGIKVDIPQHSSAERFHIYATPAVASSATPVQSDLWFVGQAVASATGVTSLVHKESLKPGLDSMLFTPPNGGTSKMGAFFRASLGGKSMYELDLAFLGAHFERSILSYFNYVCTNGRTYALVDNVGQEVLAARSAYDLYQA